MDSSGEVPLLDNSGSRICFSRIFTCLLITSVAGLIGFAVLFVLCMNDDGNHFHRIQPELQLNSILVCPTIRDSVIWDFKFDLINTEKDSNFCLNRGFGFDVSVLLYNQTKLLTKSFATPVSPRVCIYPGNRTSLVGLVEDTSCSIQDLINEYSDDSTTGTIRLDLKIHRHDLDYACGDAKVELSSSFSSSSSCGSMVGDPFACAYPPLPPPHCSSSCRFWFCAAPMVAIFGPLIFSAIIIGVVVYLAIKCPCSCW